MKVIKNTISIIIILVVICFVGQDCIAAQSLAQRATLSPRLSIDSISLKFSAIKILNNNLSKSFYSHYTQAQGSSHFQKWTHEDFLTIFAGHFANSRKKIISAASRAANREKVVVLGAGYCLDIPVVELAELFEEVVLLDINLEALEKVYRELPENLQKKVIIEPADLSPMISTLVGKAQEIILYADSANQAYERIEQLIRDATPRAYKKVHTAHNADLVVSSAVMPEIVLTYFMGSVDFLFERKFGMSLSTFDNKWQEKISRLNSDSVIEHSNLIDNRGDRVAL